MMILQQTRGALSSGDQCSLDLPFAVTKSLTARIGPTPTFTRASAASFIGSDGLIQTAATNAPRFDHDPVTLACKGLLIEESRTNIILRSQEFATSWTQSNIQIPVSGFASPSGESNAFSIVENNTTSIHIIQLNSPSAITAGLPYTSSVYAKANGATSFQMVFNTSSFGAGLFANFIISGNGSVGTSFGVTASIQKLPNGWFRCSITIASASGGGSFTGYSVIALNDDNSSAVRIPSYLGDGTTGIYLWGAQLEAGSFASSYIPTTTATAVRSADVCSIAGSDFSSIWNGSEASVLFSGSRIANQNGQNSWSLSSNTNATNINLNRTITLESISGASVSIVNIAAFTTLQDYKVASALKSGDYAMSVNGASIIASPSTFALSLNKLTIGMNYPNNGQLNGWIKGMKFYRKRISNAKLQALTV